MGRRALRVATPHECLSAYGYAPGAAWGGQEKSGTARLHGCVEPFGTLLNRSSGPAWDAGTCLQTGEGERG